MQTNIDSTAILKLCQGKAMGSDLFFLMSSKYESEKEKQSQMNVRVLAMLGKILQCQYK